MLKLLRFLVLLGSVLPIFALSTTDLQRKAADVQRKFGLQEWRVQVRFVTFDEMVEQNKCQCFGESLIFPKTKTAAVMILDDAGYRTLGWTNMSAIHAQEKFAVLHEILHIFIEIEHPEFSDDQEELAVRQLSRVVEHQPELK